MDAFKNDYEFLETMNHPPTKRKKPFNKIFESKKTFKCPKGFKVCNCKKKTKCKKIKKPTKKNVYRLSEM